MSTDRVELKGKRNLMVICDKRITAHIWPPGLLFDTYALSDAHWINMTLLIKLTLAEVADEFRA